MKKTFGVLLTLTCLSLLAAVVVVTEVPTVAAENAEEPEVRRAVVFESPDAALDLEAKLTPPEATPQSFSDWNCNDVSWDTAIQCACFDNGLGGVGSGAGTLDCLASLDGNTVKTEVQNGGYEGVCTASAFCDGPKSFFCDGESNCQARIDTATGAGWVSCDGTKTNFTC